MESVKRNRLLCFAFVAGPLLMTAAAFVYAAGLGVSATDTTNYIEGIIGCYGIVLFIPIYWALSKRLSESNRVLANITYVTGLLGPATGFTHMYSRIFEYELRLHGAGDGVWQSFYANPGSELMSVAILGILFPLTSVLLGIGFLFARKMQAWMCVGLILAGLLFPAAMITNSKELMQTAYPVACMLWSVVFINYNFTVMNAKTVRQLS